MLYLTIIGAAFVAWLIVATLFTPHIPYHTEATLDARGDHLIRVLEATCQTHLESGNRVEILTNGETYYPAMLSAIRAARETINMECYIFKKGEIGNAFVEALAERARAGVRVTLVMDAIGSFGAYRKLARPLRAAGARVAAYQRFTWYRLSRLNNRTHRELLVADGRIAFIGGAGIADWWAFPTFKRLRWHTPWRDTMARIEGPVVAALQGVAAENWLECCGEIITGPDYFPNLKAVGDTTAFVVKSSPSDRATASRVTFQLLMEAADKSVRISTPYFLPDRALRRALCETARRGVKISVIVPGRSTDQKWVRLASRRMWGELLEAGVRIFEYRVTMTHAKVFIADDLWAVLGTTNIDNRSFEHNDEVNLAMRDPQVATRLLEDYERDIADSNEISLERWRRRALWEKIVGPFVWILERQQ
jgi:cardiolipin synthase A/B